MPVEDEEATASEAIFLDFFGFLFNSKKMWNRNPQVFILIVYFFSRRAASVRSGRRKTTKLKIDVKLPANVRACVPAVVAAAALLQVARHADW